MLDECLACLCCCFDFEPEPQPRNPNPRKTRKPAREYRLITKYQKEDFVRIADEERRASNAKAYACPICTYYYNRNNLLTSGILACGECTNCICYECFLSYDQKTN
jgi:hypothetical protein